MDDVMMASPMVESRGLLTDCKRLAGLQRFDPTLKG
jgi:hypothetical protein